MYACVAIIISDESLYSCNIIGVFITVAVGLIGRQVQY